MKQDKERFYKSFMTIRKVYVRPNLSKRLSLGHQHTNNLPLGLEPIGPKS